jgi:hypothetical protein
MEHVEALLGFQPSNRLTKSLFGVSLEDFSVLLSFGEELVPMEVLWLLYYLKNYPTEDVGGAWARVSPKTWRTRVMRTAQLLSDCLPSVRRPNSERSWYLHPTDRL